jgi:hypothetical protein
VGQLGSLPTPMLHFNFLVGDCFPVAASLEDRFGSVRFGSVRFGSVQFGSARFGSVRFGSVPLGFARFGDWDVHCRALTACAFCIGLIGHASLSGECTHTIEEEADSVRWGYAPGKHTVLCSKYMSLRRDGCVQAVLLSSTLRTLVYWRL